MSNPNTTTDTEQYMANKSFDPDYQVEMVEVVGYDAVNGVLRPILVTNTGLLKVTV